MIYVNHKQRNSTLQIAPRPPVLSSYQEDWQNICLECHEQPAHELHPHLGPQHRVAIFHSQQQPIASERRFDSGWEREQICDGDIIVIPASVTHSGVFYDQLRAVVMIFDPAYIANLAPDAIDPDRIELLPSFAKPDPLLSQIGLTLKQELELDTFHGSLYIDTLSNAAAMHLIHKYSSNQLKIKPYSERLPKPQLAAVLEYINEHLSEPIRLTKLAEIARMSQFYFSIFFKKSMGIAPYQYVINQRVELAKQLLKQTDLNILDIAIESGFTHSSHLARHFKKLVGISPLLFRKNHKGSSQ